jgi:hypothetical protein
LDESLFAFTVTRPERPQARKPKKPTAPCLGYVDAWSALTRITCSF